MDNTNMQPNQEITKKKKWLLPVILGVAALLVIGLGVGGFIYIKSVALPKKEVQRNLDLGDKYLTDMDYEKAVLSYKEAITIDPKNVKAYVGLGDAYLAWADELVEEGDTEEAIKKLKKGIKELKPGIDETGSDEVKEKKEELEERKKKIEGGESNQKHGKADKEEKNDLPENDSKEVQAEVDYELIYKPVLEEVYNFVSEKGGSGEYGMQGYQYVGGIMDDVVFGDRNALFNSIGYVIMDVNDDGISELLVCNRYESSIVVGDGFTYKDGKIIEFLTGGYRHECYWIENGRFLCTSNGSAWDCSLAQEYLPKDGTELICESLYFTTTFNGEDTVYFRDNINFSSDPSTAESISKADFDNYMNSIHYGNLDLIPIGTIGN